jgi:peptidoglycan/xylan/chitin deacetylase (PgdA/CDA1 family)
MRKLATMLAVVLLVWGLPGLPTPVRVAAAPASPSVPAPSSRLVSVEPCRLVDTRSGTGYTRLGPNVIRVDASGRCGVGDAPTALALSLVIVDPDGAGFVTLYPHGGDRPMASMLNFTAGQIRSNAAIVRVADGSFDVFQSTGGDIVIDTTGWFAAAEAATAGRFMPVAPVRLLDTRASSIVLPGSSITVPIPDGVPADASALSLNITVTESSGPGFVSAYPAGTDRPEASVLTLDGPDQTRAAGGIHTVSAQGLEIFLSGGGHVVVDISGWFTGDAAPSSGDGLFTPSDPTRVLDTREVSPLGTNVPVPPSGTVSIPSPTGAATTLAFNITSVDGAAGYVTAFAVDGPRPGTSTVNPSGGGDVVANFAIVPASAAGLRMFSLQTTHLVVDLAGTFSATLASTPDDPRVDPLPSTTPATTTSSSTTTTSTTTTTTPPTTTTSTTTTSTTTTTTSTTTTTTAPGPTLPPGNRGVVYLTFDDGPQTSATSAMMSLLEQYGIRGTFFVEGVAVNALPGVAASIRSRGHAIGNHSYDHPDLRTRTDAQILQQLNDTQDAIAAATGGYRPACMRPPYGFVDPLDGPVVTPMNTNVRNVINSTGLAITMWSHDTNDWRTDTTSVADIVSVLNTLPSAYGSSSTVLMHDFAPNTYTALQQWLPNNIGRYDFRVIPTC